MAVSVIATPAAALAHEDPCAGHEAIYRAFNRIALLEARPDVVDFAAKGRQIAQAHAQMLRVRARLGPASRPWPTPCCYSRKPLIVR